MKKNLKIFGFLFLIIIISSFSKKNVRADGVQDLVEFANMSSVIESSSTIIPYKQVYEDVNGSLDIASTIYSRDSWVNEVIELALTKEGCPYSQALREKEDTYDCSSFVRRMYQEVTGVYIGSTTNDISHNLANYEVSFEELEPGDLLWLPGHIAMYIGEGKIIHATGSVNGVCIEDAFSRIRFEKAFRAIQYIRDLIA